MWNFGKKIHNVLREMQTYPTFENVLFEFMYVLNVMYVPRKLPASWTKLTEIDDVSLLVLRKKTRNVISEIRYIRYGLCRYMRYSLYPVRVKLTLKNSPRNVISGIHGIRFALNQVCAKKSKGIPFVILKNSPGSVISGIGYIRNSLYPVWVKSGMGCVSFTVQR